MAKHVNFGMFWQVYGRQTIELPDDIDEKDEDAVIDYIKSVWDEIALPTGSYIQDSDEFDPEGGLEIVVDDD